MAKGILLDFEGAVARRTDGHLEPCVEEIRSLGYDVYRPELEAAYEFVLRVEFPQKGYDDAEAFVEGVMKALGHKPKRTELMSLAPLFMEYHRFTPYEDAERAVPALAKGRKVGIFSGFPSFLVKPALEHLPANLAVTTPKEAKAALPNPKVFQAAAQALGLKPRDVALVSTDSGDGLAVPKGLGFRTVFLRRRGDAACAHAATAIASLDELEGVLRPPARIAPRAAPAPV